MEGTDIKSLQDECRTRMNAVLDHLRRELAGVRTGRASTALLDPVMVEAYGATMPVNQVAQLSIPEPTMILAQPFDPSLINAIEKAIRASNLGLNPSNDGKLIRLPIPALTAERRKELVKRLHHMAEDHRVAIRNIRRDGNESVKKLLKDKKITEDEDKRAHDDIQKLTDTHMQKLEQAMKSKEKEILEIS